MSKRIRVAILADFPTSALGGTASGRGGGQFCTWLPQLAFGLKEYDDLEMHWVIRDREVGRPVVEEALGQFFHRLPAVPMTVDLLMGCRLARRTLRRAIREIQPDLVHAWGTERIYSCVLVDCGIPTILSVQGVLTEYDRVAGVDMDWRVRKRWHPNRNLFKLLQW